MIKLDLGMRKRIAAKMAPENRSLGSPENTLVFRWYLIKIGIDTRDVTPVNVKEIAAPARPKNGTRTKSEIMYCNAEPAINIPANLGFAIPISTEERVYPNIRRNVPTIRI